MASCCLTSLSAILKPKSPSYPFLSIPSKQKLLPFSSSSFPSNKLPVQRRTLTALVAQTSDWAPRQDEEPGLDLEQQQQGEEGPEALVSDWEGEGEEQTESGEEGGDGYAEEEGEEEPYLPPPEEAKLFVGNLPYDVESADLAELFEKAGIVESAEVIYNRETDQSRGFGFVVMSTIEEAEKAVEMFNRYVWNFVVSQLLERKEHKNGGVVDMVSFSMLSETQMYLVGLQPCQLLYDIASRQHPLWIKLFQAPSLFA